VIAPGGLPCPLAPGKRSHCELQLELIRREAYSTRVGLAHLACGRQRADVQSGRTRTARHARSHSCRVHHAHPRRPHSGHHARLARAHFVGLESCTAPTLSRTTPVPVVVLPIAVPLLMAKSATPLGPPISWPLSSASCPRGPIGVRSGETGVQWQPACGTPRELARLLPVPCYCASPQAGLAWTPPQIRRRFQAWNLSTTEGQGDDSNTCLQAQA